jgi:hypothetical protein
LAEARRGTERLNSELEALREKVREAERKEYERAEEVKRLRRSLRERELMLMQREGVAGGVSFGPAPPSLVRSP